MNVLTFPFFFSVDQMCGSRGPVGTSNIQESALPFDLSVFKSLLQIEVSVCIFYSATLLPHLYCVMLALEIKPFFPRSMTITAANLSLAFLKVVNGIKGTALCHLSCCCCCLQFVAEPITLVWYYTIKHIKME